MVNRGAVRGSVVDCLPTCTKAQTWLLSSCNSSTWKVEDCQKFKASPVHTESSRAAEPEPTVTSCPDHPRCFANLCLDIGGGACFQDRQVPRKGRKKVQGPARERVLIQASLSLSTGCREGSRGHLLPPVTTQPSPEGCPGSQSTPSM